MASERDDFDSDTEPDEPTDNPLRLVPRAAIAIGGIAVAMVALVWSYSLVRALI